MYASLCVQCVRLNLNIARHLVSFNDVCDSCWRETYEQFYIVENQGESNTT